MTRKLRGLHWAVIGAVAAGLVTAAVGGAATGGNFILGTANSANSTTSLSGSIPGGPQLKVSNGGGGAGIIASSGSGEGLHSSGVTGVVGVTGTGIAGVAGTVSSSSSVNAYGVEGINKSTQDDAGAGVYGQKAAGGAGVEGYGASGNAGVYAHTKHGVGLWAASSQENGAAAIMDGQLEMNGTIDLSLFSIFDGSSTPNVGKGNWARLANQNPTNITNLIGNHGQFLIIVCDPNGPDHGNTVLQKGAHLELSSNFTCTNGSGSTLTLIHDSVQDRWYELSRSSNP